MSTTIFVYTISSIGKVGAWSRYVFPFVIDYTTQLGNDLFLRAGDTVYRLDQDALDDDGVAFTSVIWWPWLDFGQIGRQKMMAGFDIQGDGTVSVQFGYDERSDTVLTDSWNINPVTDSLPDMVLPFPLTAPSISVKLTYEGPQAWKWDGFTVYLQDQRLMS
jgi:hypothetical protein